MKRMMVCLVALFLLIGVLIIPAKAQKYSYIAIYRDGSIFPSDAPISTVDNITYVLLENIQGSIIIERNNTILDGSFHTIEPLPNSLGYSAGIDCSAINNVTIKNCNVSKFNYNYGAPQWGMRFLSCSNMTFKENNLTDNLSGIFLLYCSNNIIADNDFSGNNQGLSMLNATGNIITGNKIENSTVGIDSGNSTGNRVYDNNFLDNDQAVANDVPYPNFLDNGFEGNYWSDYNGTDNNQDGIGDTPYIIDANNTDHYPLMGIFQSFNVSAFDFRHNVYVSEEVNTISNSTVVQVQLVNDWLVEKQYPWRLQLTIQCENGTIGFYRITFPNDLLNSYYYPVTVNPIVGQNIYPVSKIVQSNGTCTTIYFSFNQTYFSYYDFNYYINIVPEFPSFLILPLFFMTTLLAVIVYRKRLTRN